MKLSEQIRTLPAYSLYQCPMPDIQKELDNWAAQVEAMEAELEELRGETGQPANT